VVFALRSPQQGTEGSLAKTMPKGLQRIKVFGCNKKHKFTKVWGRCGGLAPTLRSLTEKQ